MYDELIKRLRASCESCKLWDGYKCCLKGECSAQTRLQAADAIDELSHIQIAPEKIIQTMWIPVTERLPEAREVVLVCGKRGGVYTAEHNRNALRPGSFWKLNSKNHHCEPTHWMPLPQPPESEGSNED